MLLLDIITLTTFFEGGRMIHLGIDFGTTNTVVAYELDGKYNILNFNEHSFIPSLITKYKDNYYFGFDALSLLSEKQALVIHSIKQYLHNYYHNKTLTIDNHTISIEDVLIGFFSYLKERIEVALPFDSKTGWDVIATVPANASSQQRWIMLEAMRKAGLCVRALLNEPTASGFEFSHYFLKGNAKEKDVYYVLIYDFGGGTFDVSLIKVKESQYQVIGSTGQNQLGGDIFDEKLFNLACEKVALDKRRLSYRQKIEGILESRTLKESISLSRGFLQRNLNFDFENINIQSKIAKIKSNEYYEAIKPEINRTIELIEELLQSQTIKSASLGLDSIDYIYLVGGSSKLPYVIHAIQKVFTKAKVKVSDNTFATSALGAAIYSSKKDVKLIERFTRNFGVIRLYNGREIFDPIFPKGTELPQTENQVTKIIRDYDPEFNIGHFKFLECSEINPDLSPSGDINLITEIRFPYDPELNIIENQTIERKDLSHIRVCEEYHCDAFGIINARITRKNDGFTVGYNIN
ncbi:MAG: Hsp70 family protein [Candidatus Hydrogenedentota bacterium]